MIGADDADAVELDQLNGSAIEALPFSTADYRVMMYGRPLVQ